MFPCAPKALCLWACLLSLPAEAQTIAHDLHINFLGTAEITVTSTSEHYYILYSRRELGDDTERPMAMTLGEDGTTTLHDPLGRYPDQGFYRVMEHRRDAPVDTDGDGLDDVQELLDSPRLNPLNPLKTLDAPIEFEDGTALIPDRATFREMSYQGEEVSRDTHLTDLEFVKFQIEGLDSGDPEVFFLNTVNHRTHPGWMREVGIVWDRGGDGAGKSRGEIIFHPHVLSPNGQAGVFRWEFQPNDSFAFEDVQLASTVLARAMPFLRNNLMYYPMPAAALPLYHREKALYDDSRVPILLEEDLFAEIAYLPLNFEEGYGRLRLMTLDERPTARDVVLYKTLPNELPRVAGIITEVPQTPLSHVNLRAIQDRLPNAFIREASTVPSIARLIGKQVYFSVSEDGYEIREATTEEVDTHFETIRPTEPQVPVRDLSKTTHLPLTEIRFEDSASFGVKTANLATMHTIGFPEGTIPDGFAIPFYFYDTFMKHNGLDQEVQGLLDNEALKEDSEALEIALEDLREAIKDGNMPSSLTEALTELQDAFPQGASIRCRSSTNNEDLEGFSGAGLYDSFTHHPDEGHLSKSIKQVYASLWNYRAFDEREFYRIDHQAAAMGVLLHQNFADELANGVAVTTDPFYQTDDNFYLNTQVGEDLVTNPEGESVPEELLLNKDRGSDYTLVRPSNRVPDGQQILSRSQLIDLQIVLKRIDQTFRTHYKVLPWTENFAIEVEFKITAEGALSIKQARPWVF